MCQATQMMCNSEREAEGNAQRYRNDQLQRQRQTQQQGSNDFANKVYIEMARPLALKAFNEMPTCFHSQQERKLGEKSWKLISEYSDAIRDMASAQKPDRLDIKAKNPQFISDCQPPTPAEIAADHLKSVYAEVEAMPKCFNDDEMRIHAAVSWNEYSIDQIKNSKGDNARKRSSKQLNASAKNPKNIEICLASSTEMQRKLDRTN